MTSTLKVKSRIINRLEDELKSEKDSELTSDIIEEINFIEDGEVLNTTSTWISIEDELPEPGVTVFVTGNGFFNGYEASVQRWERVVDPKHLEDEPHWFGTREMEPYEDFNITNWMPLPKAPKAIKTIKIKTSK